MVYWADVLYDKPLVESARAESLEAAAEAGESRPSPMEWRTSCAARSASSWRASRASSATTAVAEEDPRAARSADRPDARAGAAAGLRQERIMAYLLRDVHHYLYNVDFSPRLGAATASRTRSASASSPAIEEAAVARAPTSW
jgi:hypothetical protein